jgi:signal transduction histidine kinase
MMEMLQRLPVPPADVQRHQEMMRYMWGRRWGVPPETAEEGTTPPALREKSFWEGSLFGVAIGARSFPGIIAVHADADYILNFRKEIGVEREIEELGRQPGIESVGLLGPELTLLAHSDPSRIGRREDDSVARQALSEQQSVSRLVTREGKEIFEVLRPLLLDGSRIGLLRIDFSTAPLERAYRQGLSSAITLSLVVLAMGALGLGLIFYAQHRHLSEVNRLESEVEQRERLSSLGNLAATVAHEIRNPLNAISMGLQRLRREFQPSDGAAEYSRMVELTQGEVKRLNSIVEEFLSLGRPLALKLDSVKVEELLREVAALVEADAEARKIQLCLSVPSDLPTARWDRDQMKQLLLNLVMNGFEAMPEGGALSIGASALRSSLVVTVEDTGEGVPPELLPKIFEPYVTTKMKGLGLGLVVARRIAEAHGGSIRVESEPGNGSRFTIALPLETSRSPIENPKSEIRNPNDG